MAGLHNTPEGRCDFFHFVDEGTGLGKLITLPRKNRAGCSGVFLTPRAHVPQAQKFRSPWLPSSSKLGHLWNGQMKTWFLQSAQQLLNRAVDRNTAALCPGEQRGTWPQLALGTSCLQKHRSGRNPEDRGEGPPGKGQMNSNHFFFQHPGEGVL